MGDYKFEILSELVKHDDYEFDTVLFGENLEKYRSMLHQMDWYDLLINRVLENDGRRKTIITDKGRNYYFDELLPRRSQLTNSATNVPIHSEAMTTGMRIYNFINKYIVVLIFGLLGAVASYFTILQFFIENNWFGMGKK